MSRLNRSTRRRAIVGLLVVAGSIAVAGTARAATASAGPASPSHVALSLDLPVITPHEGQGQGQGPIDSLGCLLFAYNLGPFGPLGPWGPMGPLHDRPHPACFGGGPDFNKGK